VQQQVGLRSDVLPGQQVVDLLAPLVRGGDPPTLLERLTGLLVAGDRVDERVPPVRVVDGNVCAASESVGERPEEGTTRIIDQGVDVATARHSAPRGTLDGRTLSWPQATRPRSAMAAALSAARPRRLPVCPGRSTGRPGR